MSKKMNKYSDPRIVKYYALIDKAETIAKALKHSGYIMCSLCREWKPEAEFYKNKYGEVVGDCQDCVSRTHSKRKSRLRNATHYNTYMRTS